MLTKPEQFHVFDLLKAGSSVQEIANITGKSLMTIYKYKRCGGQLQDGNYRRTESSTYKDLEPFQEQVDQHIKRRKLKPNAVYVLLQKQGYRGNLRAFNNFYRQRKQQIRVKGELHHRETEPGEEAQVDWAHFGEIEVNGKREKVYLFSYLLSWSRALYLEFVCRQNQATLQLCHLHAFEKLGIPKIILYDNMKTVVDRREKLPDHTKQVIYNLKFLDFARHYHFQPIACSPYHPQSKGKVEASFSFVRNEFPRCTPSMNETLESLNNRITTWLEVKAQPRTHGTTGEVPYERWLKEKALLTFPSNMPPYNAPVVQDHQTSQFGIINHKGVTYHLGQKYARTKRMVREINDYGLPYLEIYHQNKLIKPVPVPSKKPSWVTVFDESDEVEKLVKISKTSNIPKTKESAKSYGISVASRELDYYNINLSEGAHYG